MDTNALIIAFHRACRQAQLDEMNCLTYVDKNNKRRKKREVKARVALCYEFVKYRRENKQKLVVLSQQLPDTKQS